MVVLGYINLLAFLIKICTAEVSVFYLGHNVATETDENNTVKLIEGSDLVLECFNDVDNVTFTWLRNGVKFTTNNVLHLQKIGLEDEGIYTCSVSYGSHVDNVLKTDSQFVFIEVLYPPSKPFMKIPNSVLFGEVVSLSCLSTANPEPSFQWRKTRLDGLLLSRNTTYVFTAPAPTYLNRFYCILQGFMLPTFSEPVKFFVSTSDFLNVHTKARIKNTYPRRYIYSNEGDFLNLKGDGDGSPAPTLWWTKVGDDRYFVKGSRLYFYHIVMSDAGDYVFNAGNTVVSANGTKIDVHMTYVFHVHVLAVNKPKTDDPQLSCGDCLSKCQQKFPSTSPSTFNITEPVKFITSGNQIDNSVSCSPEQNQNKTYFKLEEMKSEDNATLLILIIISVSGWTLTFVMLLLIIYIYKKKNRRQECNNETRTDDTINNQNSYQTTGAVSAYVTDARIADAHYTDLTTYDQIASSQWSRSGHGGDDNVSYLNDAESVLTQTSVITYTEPVTYTEPATNTETATNTEPAINRHFVT